MSDAESTVKFAIFDAITSNWYKQDAQLMRDEVFDKIFEPHLVWAIKEYLIEIQSTQNKNKQ